MNIDTKSAITKDKCFCFFVFFLKRDHKVNINEKRKLYLEANCKCTAMGSHKFLRNGK